MKTTRKNVLMNKVTINFNVLGSLMKDWITGMALVLSTLRGVVPRIGTPSSVRSRRSQRISLVAEDMDLYSASAEVLEIVACFLHFHEMREEPKNIHQPVVDRLVSGHPA
eukprot:TRINITY_DN32976_c3_g1_i1.p2 TRINITY_DN32976_c3_g1~~TRINITY_DN32976_c3_g1_i1.p2  ORF type:complete len:110 (-),score=13.35 TRINITY_DN32976_c3_g1_i1:676-1005(-)